VGLEGQRAAGSATKLVNVPLFQLHNGRAEVPDLPRLSNAMRRPVTKSKPAPTARAAQPNPTLGYSGLPVLSPTWVRAGLAVLTVLLLAPFLAKAIHIDDTLFVWAAKQIVKHPLDPYGFPVVWYKTSMPMHEVNLNPPLAAYYAALAGAWAGWSEFHLHLAFLVPAVIVVLGVYQLARGLCDSPALAAALTLAAPGFLVSATTLMSDVPMLALWMVAVVLWRKGLETEDPIHLGASAVIMAACALTKYFGACLIPLLLLYSIWKQRRFGWWALYFLIPVCILGGYQIWTQTLYGHGLLSEAVRTSQERDRYPRSPLATFEIALSFLGGCALPALAFVPWLWGKRAMLVGLAFSSVSAVAIALGWIDTAGSFPRDHQWFLAAQLALFIAGGLSALGLAWSDFWRRREADSVLLLAWVLGTFVFATFVNWTVNARLVLPLVPAVAILVVRALGSNPKRGSISWMLTAPLSASLLLSLWVTWSDTKLANSAREAAEVIHRATGNRSGNVLFQGHWGFQYYLEAFGARPLDFQQFNFSSSDTIVEPYNNNNVAPWPPMMIVSNSLVAINTRQWVTTMHRARAAGFYSSIFGVLPFAFGPVPEEKYELISPSDLGTALYRLGQIDEAVRLRPAYSEALWAMASTLDGQGEYEEAIRFYRAALKAQPEQAGILNNLAWLLASCPEAASRNGPEAVRLATRACELTKYSQPLLIGTLAAAQAEAGDFPAAIATAERAAALATALHLEDIAARNRELIQLYRQGQAFHEEQKKTTDKPR
jgi:tetratricopeptide (TPR) repeat protein